MTTYIRVNNKGVAQDTFEMPNGWDMPITQLFDPRAGEWVDITDVNPKPQYGWTYDSGKFTPPPPPNNIQQADSWFERVTGYRVPMPDLMRKSIGQEALTRAVPTKPPDAKE